MRSSDPLVSLLDEARADDAGTGRRRERSLRRQAEESATFAGTLLDLAERGVAVTVRTVAGRVSHGVILAVATDFVVLRCRDRSDVCLRLAALVTVRPDTGLRQGPATGDRPAPLDLLLVEVLAGLAPDRARVGLVVSGDVVSGELRAVGADVVTLRLEGGRPATCYLAAGSIDEVVVGPGP